MSVPWYEDDEFWVAVTTALFDPDRLAGTGAEVDAIVELTGLLPRQRVLDLCCGPGRHCIETAAWLRMEPGTRPQTQSALNRTA